MKVENIKWDTDGKDIEELGLPTEVEIPDELISGYDEKEIDYYYSNISDWLSDKYGFCHGGFELVD